MTIQRDDRGRVVLLRGRRVVGVYCSRRTAARRRRQLR